MKHFKCMLLIGLIAQSQSALAMNALENKQAKVEFYESKLAITAKGGPLYSPAAETPQAGIPTPPPPPPMTDLPKKKLPPPPPPQSAKPKTQSGQSGRPPKSASQPTLEGELERKLEQRKQGSEGQTKEVSNIDEQLEQQKATKEPKKDLMSELQRKAQEKQAKRNVEDIEKQLKEQETAPKTPTTPKGLLLEEIVKKGKKNEGKYEKMDINKTIAEQQTAKKEELKKTESDKTAAGMIRNVLAQTQATLSGTQDPAKKLRDRFDSAKSTNNIKEIEQIKKDVEDEIGWGEDVEIYQALLTEIETYLKTIKK